MKQYVLAVLLASLASHCLAADTALEALLTRGNGAIDNSTELEPTRLRLEIGRAIATAHGRKDRSGEARLHLVLAQLALPTDTQLGVAELARAVGLDPTLEGAHCVRGVALQAQNRPSEAEGELRTAYVTEPAFRERAAYHLGLLFEERGDQDRAYAYLTRASRVAPVPIAYTRELAQLAILTGRDDQALELMDRVASELHAADPTRSIDGILVQAFGQSMAMHHLTVSTSYVIAERVVAANRLIPIKTWGGTTRLASLYVAALDALEIGDETAFTEFRARIGELMAAPAADNGPLWTRLSTLAAHFAKLCADLDQYRTSMEPLIIQDPRLLFEFAQMVLGLDAAHRDIAVGATAYGIDAWLSRFGAGAAPADRERARLLNARLIASIIDAHQRLITQRPLERLYQEPVGESAEIDRAAATALAAFGRRAEAIARLRTSAEKLPDARTYSMLANDLEQDGKWTDAESALRRAVAVAPSADEEFYRGELGWQLGTSLGRSAEAVELLQQDLWSKSLSLPNQLALAGRICELLPRLGRYDEAAALYAETQRRAPRLLTGNGNELLTSALVRYDAALMAGVRGEVGPALDALRELLNEIPETIANDPERQTALVRIEILRRIAQLEIAIGQYDPAQQTLQRVSTLVAAERSGLRGREQALIQDTLALLAEKRADERAEYRNDLDAYDVAADEDEVRRLLDLEFASRKLGRGTEAAGWLAIAYARVTQRAAQFPGSDTLADLAAVERRQGNFPAAIDADLKRRQLAVDQGLPVAEAQALMSLAVNQNSSGREGDALDSYRAARDIYRKLSQRSDEAGAELALADESDFVGDVLEARQSYERAMSIYEAAGLREQQAATLVGLADLEREQGRYPAADALAVRALAIYSALGNPYSIVATNGLRASILIDSNRSGDALATLEPMTKLVQSAGSPALDAELKQQMALARLAAGDLEGAENAARDSLAIARPLERNGANVSASRTLAEVQIRRLQAAGKGGTADPARLEEIDQLLTYVESRTTDATGQRLDWRTIYLRGQWHELRGAPEPALQCYRNAIALIELRRVGNGVNDDAKFVDHYRPVYSAILNLLQSLGHGAEMFDYASRLEAAEYAGNGSIIGVGPNRTSSINHAGLSRRLSDINEEIRGLESLDGANRDPERLRWLQATQTQLKKELNAVTAKLELPGVRAKSDSQNVGLDAKFYETNHSILPAGTVLLQPVLLDNQLLLLVYTHEQPYSRPVPLAALSRPGEPAYDAAQFKSDVTRFIGCVREEKGCTGANAGLAERLYQALILPIEPELNIDPKRDTETASNNNRRLLMSPLGVLRQIPFAALRDSQGRYLLERVPIVNVAQRIAVGVDVAHMDQLRFLALMGTQDDLAAVQTEGQVIESTFPGSRVLYGSNARATALEWSQRPFDYNAVALATHARFDERARYLQFADDEHLEPERLAEYAGSWQGVSLVVLSACETAVWVKDSASAYNSFIASLEDQVLTVIGTQWRVDDTVTERIMAGFYERLHAGEPAAVALQKAQVALIGTDQGAPYYWAPYQVYGDWR